MCVVPRRRLNYSIGNSDIADVNMRISTQTVGGTTSSTRDL